MKKPHQAKTKPTLGLPVYDSLAACSGATGIPRSVIQAAKKAGCPAFRSNRVDLAVLLPWIFSGEGKDPDDMSIEQIEKKKVEEEWRILELKRMTMDGTLINVAQMQAMIGQFVSSIRTTWLSMPTAIAPRCNPTDPELAEKALKEWVNTALRLTQADFGEKAKEMEDGEDA